MKVIAALMTVALVATTASAGWESIGPDGGYILAFGIDPQQPATLYAIPHSYPENVRLFRSPDAGASWESVGELPTQWVMSFMVDPFADSLFYVGGRERNSIFLTTDRGRSWTTVSMPGYVTAMAADPLVPGRLYCSGQYNYGGTNSAVLYMSTDYGRNWSASVPAPGTAGIGYAAAADPVSSGTVYLGAGDGQLYRSADAGQNWEPANSGIPVNATTQRISVNRADNRVLIAATSAGVYRSSDAGASWSAVGAMSVTMSAGFSPADPAVAYAHGQTDQMRILVSTDTGATWTQPVPGYAPSKAAQLHVDPGSGTTAYLNTETGIYRTTDTGSNWHGAHAGLRLARIPAMAAHPVDGRRVYVAVNNDGIHRTTSSGETWERCGYFPACDNIAGIGVAPGIHGDIVYALEGAG